MSRTKQFDPATAVEQAMMLFWRKGYASTTPQELSDELGIGKGSLYHAFESKRGLFALSLQRYADARLEGLATYLQQSGPVKERLRQVLLKLISGRGGSPVRGCLAVNTAVELGDTDASAREAVRSIFAGMEKLFARAIEEGQRLGEIDSSKDAVQLASLLLGSMVGLQVLSRAADSPARMRRIVDALIDLL